MNIGTIRKGRFHILLLIILVCNVCLSRQKPGFVLKKVYNVTARDNVGLHTVVFYYLGQLSKKNPVVLIRTPYNAQGYGNKMESFVQRGFLVVGQDMRGMHGSEGIFSFWRKSGEDGFDTIQWILNQKWSNGKIFTFGASADGITQCMLPETNPNLSGQCPLVATTRLHESFMQDGAFRASLSINWLTSAVKQAWYVDVLKENESFSTFWNQTDLKEQFDKVHIDYPSVHIGGIYDIFQKGTLEAFDMYRQKNPKSTYLALNSGGHCGKPAIDFPDGQKLLSSSLAYCSDMFSGKPPFKNFVNFYVTGKNGSSEFPGGNFWVSMDEFPQSKPWELFLTHDMKLSASQPEETSKMSFIYDPNYPTRTLAGNNLFLPCGPQIVNSIEERSDNLVFTSDVLTNYVAILGNIVVNLEVSSNCSDTDFVCRLSDVYENGDSLQLNDGILRMKWRNSKEKPELMIPNTKYQIELDLWFNSVIISPGHKLRLACTSSNSPRFSPNGNSGKLLKDETKSDYVVAENNIFIHNSKIVLPIVNLKELEENTVNTEKDYPKTLNEFEIIFI